jgi:hypothetical protein
LDPFILLIIVFIVAPLIERLLKAGKQNQPPGVPPEQQRPPRQVQRPRDEPPSRVVVRREEDDAAATMLPDDLWEILTGEKRAPQQPAPEPVAEAEEYETYDEQFGGEAETLEQTSAGEWIALPPEPEPAAPTRPQPSVPAQRPSGWQDYRQERDRVAARRSSPPIRAERGYVRPMPSYEAPKIVSLEDLEIDDELRHDRFHQKLEQLPPPARGRTRTPNAFRFTTDDDLRRAIVMSEVLGRPRGLD